MVLPHASDGLILAEVLTQKNIVVLKDTNMFVARKDSQLGVTLTNMIKVASSSNFVVVDRVNGVCPMSEDSARELVSGGKLEGVPSQGTDMAMATTYYTVRLGSLCELTIT